MAQIAKSASSCDAAQILGFAVIRLVRRHQRRALLQRHRVVERIEQVMVEGDRHVGSALQYCHTMDQRGFMSSRNTRASSTDAGIEPREDRDDLGDPVTRSKQFGIHCARSQRPPPRPGPDAARPSSHPRNHLTATLASTTSFTGGLARELPDILIAERRVLFPDAQQLLDQRVERLLCLTRLLVWRHFLSSSRAPDLIVRHGPAAARSAAAARRIPRPAIALLLLDGPAHQPGDDGTLVLTFEGLVEGLSFTSSGMEKFIVAMQVVHC